MAASKTAPELLEVELFENQRRYPIGGWSTKRLPTDRANWSSSDGKKDRTKQEIESELPAVYKWTSEWEVEKRDGRTDKDGWSYAFDFQMDYHPQSSFNTHVRRRRWIRRASRPSKSEGDQIMFPASFVNFSMIQAAEPEFDLVEEAEVQHLERTHEFKSEKEWEADKDVRECRSCKEPFGIMRRKHHCRRCGRIFCDNCCKPNAEYENMRVCKLCIKAEAERLEEERRLEKERREREQAERQARMEWEHAVDCNFKLEESSRLEIVMQRATQLERFTQIYKREKKAATEATNERVETEQTALRKVRDGLTVDEWNAIKGPRAGSLTITVVRAKALVPRRPFMSCNSRVVITNTSTGKEYKSDVKDGSVDPEYDFDEYFAVEDDTKPILITIREYRTGGTVCVGKLDLRYAYENLVRRVSESGVYTEQGHAQIDTYNTKGEVYPSTSLVIKWKLESREQESTNFCDDCGRVEHRCTCDTETRTARRQRVQLEELKRQAEIDEAREEREARERAEQEEREAAERKWRNEELTRILGENDYNEREARRALEVKETKQRLWITDQRAQNAAAIRQAAVHKEIIENAMKELARMNASNEQALMGSSLGRWHLLTSERKHKRLDEEEKARVAAELAAAGAAVAASNKEAEAEKKKRDDEERTRDEMEKYDEGKDDYNDVKTDHDGNPRVTEVHDDKAKKANQDDRGCCTVM